MKSLLLSTACALVLAGLLPAQGNLLKNGDFSNGMTSWTGSGNGGNPQTGIAHGTTPVTEVFDTTGAGANPAFTILPGGNTNQNPNNPPYLLTQQALVIPAPMELHMDVCLTGPNGNAQGGHIKISVAGVEMATWSEYAGGFTAGTYRRHLTFLFTPTVGGPQNVTIELWRERFVWSWSSATAHTPKMAIDNVYFAPAQRPVLYCQGERKIGGSLAIDLVGTGGSAAVIMLSAGRGPGMAIPGFAGTFQLDLKAGLFFLASGFFDKSGGFTSSTPIPNDPALVGALLVFQGLEADLAGGFFGYAHDLSIY